MRLVVVQPARAGAARAPSAAVGVVRWVEEGPLLTVVVKAAFSMEGARLVPIEPTPLSLDVPSGRPAAPPGELAYASDFAPRKPAADVIVTGSACAPSPSGRIDARIALGTWERRFVARAGAPSTRIPLAPPYLFEVGGDTPTSVGPEISSASGELPPFHDEGFDYAAYSAAPSGQRPGYIDPDGALLLAGLSPGGERRIELAGLEPVVVADLSDDRMARLEMVCDTLWLDTDRQLAVMVWRAPIEVATLEAREIERLLVSLEPTAAPPSVDELRRRAGRAHLSFAAERGELRTGPIDEDEEDDLRIARYELWDHVRAPDPTLTLAEYAAVSAELAEQREPRADVLRRRGVDEDDWIVEERAWLERMAGDAAEGDASLLAEYGERYKAAQDDLGAPREERWTLADQARLGVELERAGDPGKVLAARSMTLAEWMRLDRRWSAAVAKDPGLRAEHDRHRAEALATPEPGDDELPGEDGAEANGAEVNGAPARGTGA